jgi:hypothetical protein
MNEEIKMKNNLELQVKSGNLLQITRLVIHPNSPLFLYI